MKRPLMELNCDVSIIYDDVCDVTAGRRNVPVCSCIVTLIFFVMTLRVLPLKADGTSCCVSALWRHFFLSDDVLRDVTKGTGNAPLCNCRLMLLFL